MRSLLFSSLSRHAAATPSSSASHPHPNSHSHPHPHPHSHSHPHSCASSKPTSTDTTPPTPAAAAAAAAASAASHRSSSTNSGSRTPKHAPSKPDDATVTVTVKPIRSASPSTCSSSAASVVSSSGLDAAMVKRGRVKREASSSLSPSSPPSTTTTSLCRPTTPTSPVQIPNEHSGRETAHGAVKRHAAHRTRHPHHVHSPEALSPSLAALLAVTDIPRQTRRRRRTARPLTVDEIVSDQHVSEKELSLTLGRGPLDLLLSPPEDLADDYVSASESNVGSAKARTTSADSIPSLGDSFVTDMVSSVDTPGSVGSSSHRRRLSPMRRSLEPVRSPSDATEKHPLAADGLGLDLDDMDGMDFHVFEQPADEVDKPQFLEPFKPLRSVFKSNLTASLRALRSAAKSFSGINFPSIPPDDLLTRSILTIDANVPYADERRPPVTEEMPSAELRRYLNPTTSSHIDPQPAPSRPFAASIQMQTYKVQRSRSPQWSPPSSPRSPYPAASPQTASATSPSHQHQHQHQQQPARPGNQTPVPGMRQREMRENPDFIRIAVMEMAMRKRGKLDNQRPGRARWALPPRRPSMRPYEIGPNGVPARWTPVNY
ncbi:hypothetical protein TOPH_06278 [Tolypocladium ophioglossoides CBS 100239]|uniref:Uncharacterized protein n=1 Tax=Tolypocladium ophioglossoides (strain CBS 100239) TaxID=1163406 RepID=A0A0L0N4Q5_TOLOC|nr:hypothetical protein TOPH_06278 [Tolypocladium ophioglossoides CBS 100239]